MFQDKFAEQEMMALRVFCQAKKENECLWNGTLRELEVFSLEFVRNIRLLHLSFLTKKINGKWSLWKISFAYRLLNGMNECELCGNCYNYFLKTEDIKINSSRVDLYFINYYLLGKLISK